MAIGLITRLRSSVFTFPLAALAALGMLFISETSYHDATGAFSHLVGRGQARIELQTLRRNLYEAESGQRGYLLTGRPDHLVLYRSSLPSARSALSSLARFYADDSPTATLIARLTKVTEENFAELQSSIDAYDQGQTDRWQAIVMSNVGKEKIEEARALSDQVLTIENARIRSERDGVLQTLMLNRIGIGAMTAVSLLALFMYLRQTAELDRKVSDETRRVAHERDRLEAEVAARTTELKELAQHLQTIREDERSHLARELHDELGALLTAAKLDVARLKSRLGATTPEVIERLAHLNEALNNGIALKRRIIENLRPRRSATSGSFRRWKSCFASGASAAKSPSRAACGNRRRSSRPSS